MVHNFYTRDGNIGQMYRIYGITGLFRLNPVLEHSLRMNLIVSVYIKQCACMSMKNVNFSNQSDIVLLNYMLLNLAVDSNCNCVL